MERNGLYKNITILILKPFSYDVIKHFRFKGIISALQILKAPLIVYLQK